MNKALLPAGFHDLLFPEAGVQADIVSSLTKYFEANGYLKVKPPAIEFEESLFSGAGKELESQTFRLMDPLSHKMMGVHSDITVQIARLATTRLTNEPAPIRLSYAGDVFRVQGEGLYAERQFAQAGIELIGINNAHADAEVVVVMLESLQELGVKGLCIDFTIPGLVEIILSELKVSAAEKDELFAAIKTKDAEKIAKLGAKHANLLVALADPAVDIAKLNSLKLPKSAKILCERLNDVIKILQANIDGVEISIDPLSVNKFNYHSIIGFSIFSQESKEEIGRGGRYVIADETDGVGATLYVNELFRILPKPKNIPKILATFGASRADISKLQKNGKIVITALEKSEDYKVEARRLGCTQIFANGELENI